MDEKIKLLRASFGEERVKINEDLSNHTYFGQGGIAFGFYIATSTRELTNILDLAIQLKIPFFVFGSGTKLVVSSRGFKGLAIKNRSAYIKVAAVKGKVTTSGIGVEEALVEADSGVSIKKLNDFLKMQGLTAFIGESSIQATIGGAIFVDSSLRDITQKVKVWDDTQLLDIDISKLKISTHVVLSVTLKIKAKS